MTYVLSDIHGRSSRYEVMLKRTGFSENDELYIIGDVIDRGSGGVKILRDIMGRSNVHLLMGNHELMATETFLAEDGKFQHFQLWMANGGAPTYRDLMHLTDKAERARIIDFMRSRPGCIDLEVGGRKFHLVHAFPAEDLSGQVWNRPELDTPNPFADRTLIVGHTPVMFLHGSTDRELVEYINGLRSRGEHFRIEHADGFIDIDCGCASELPEARLACLRLEDMAEFYV